MQFFRSRQWVIGRRVVLVAIIGILGFRSYGNSIVSWLARPNPQAEIQIARAEFRNDVRGDRPIWIIRLRNNSLKFTYDQISLEATYWDDDGSMVETDTIIVKQRIAPGEEKLIASYDARGRQRATRGSLKVMDATVVGR